MKRAYLPLLLIMPLVTQSQPIGSVYEAGTTYNHQQHNGTAGKMIGVDDAGYAHVVWMNTLETDLQPRHVFYNVWDPVTAAFCFPGGVQINASDQAGYTCLALDPSGFCFPAFHQIVIHPRAHSAAAIDYLPRVGTFTTVEPAHLGEMEIIWPKISRSSNGILHMVATEYTDPLMRVYYSRGEPIFDQDGHGEGVEWQNNGSGYQLVDTTMTLAADIAASPTSDRVVIVWSKSRENPIEVLNHYNNDLYMVVSEDGGLNWGPHVNITDFIPPDTVCANGDSLLCNNDTLRVCRDASVIFDDEDDIHVAFTTVHYFEFESRLDRYSSDVWHWSEDLESFSIIARYWTEGLGFELPLTHLMVQRPSLSLDPVTGYLYCSYQQYDSMAYSVAGIGMADAYVSVSTNGGLNWAVGTNVTRTVPDVFPVPSDECEHETDITLADHVVYTEGSGHLYMEYLYALNPYPDELPSLNPMRMQIIPVDSISLQPLMPDYPFHVEHAGPVTLQLPVMNSLFDESLLVPVYIWDIYDLRITSIEFSISFDMMDEYLRLDGPPDLTDCLLENWTVTYTDTIVFPPLTAAATVTATGTAPLDGGGILLYLQMETGNPGCLAVTIDLHFDDCLINGGCIRANTHDGSIWIVGSGDVEDEKTGTITEYALHPNYPNPFNAVTNIVFDLPKAERVSLKIFDVTGREVTTLADERFNAGSHTMGFNAEGLSSGVYFCRLQAGSFAESRKIILLK